MPRFLFLLALLLLPLQAMEIVHGDTAIPPQEVRTERPLIIASEQAAALGWMQMYVFHSSPAERAELLRAGQAAGTMAILPAGSRLKLLAMARNRGAFMAEIVSVGTGESRTPALGAAAHRQVPAADASYPFSWAWKPCLPSAFAPRGKRGDKGGFVGGFGLSCAAPPRLMECALRRIPR